MEENKNSIKTRLSDYVGNTPFIKIGERLYAKYEKNNPSGSVKDRVIIGIINDAEKKGLLKKGDTIVEVSSGNAGISLAMIGAERGYNVKVIVPENILEEKKEKIKLFGADLIEVPFDDYDLGRKIRDSLVKQNNWFTPNQHYNQLNIESQKTIAFEILNKIHNFGTIIDAIIVGAGTGGTIMGMNKVLKRKFPHMETIAVIPEHNMKENEKIKYGLNGIGHSEQFLLNPEVIDKYIEVKYSDAEKGINYLSKQHGISCGIISGANVFAANKWIKNNNSKGIIITIISD